MYSGESNSKGLLKFIHCVCMRSACKLPGATVHPHVLHRHHPPSQLLKAAQALRSCKHALLHRAAVTKCSFHWAPSCRWAPLPAALRPSPRHSFLKGFQPYTAAGAHAKRHSNHRQVEVALCTRQRPVPGSKAPTAPRQHAQ